MIKIVPMKTSDIPDVLKLWKIQFKKYCSNDAFPDFSKGGESVIESYITKQIKTGNAISALEDNKLAGFMAWMSFDFHNEKTSFLPITGHTASVTNKEEIYSEMYRYVSEKWVRDNIFNHLWMIYYDDRDFLDDVYRIGFGSYVIDACQSVKKNIKTINCGYRIAIAAVENADDLLEFANTSTEYYIKAPIFLKRTGFTKDKITSIIENDCVLIARDQDKIVGAMSFSTDQNFHFEHLTTMDSSYIGGIGAFIHPDYRGRGIGTALLEKTFEICAEKGKQYIHVSFESANPNASKFWPKYFKPGIRSVRRTINKDAN